MTSFGFIAMMVAGGAFGGFAGAQVICPNWLSRLTFPAAGSVVGLIVAASLLWTGLVR